MTMHPGPTYGAGLGGLNNGRYRQTAATASGSAAYQPSATNMGASLSSLAHPCAQPTEDKPIPHTGIRTGEITAVRVWTDSISGEWKTGYLHSVYMSTKWLPGEIMHSPKVKDRWGEGIHAFKTLERAMHEYHGPSFYIYGEVELWGDVVEFEYGWKAEYAKITKLYYMGGPFRRLTIWRMKRKYNVL